jgi:hypothetical protein
MEVLNWSSDLFGEGWTDLGMKPCSFQKMEIRGNSLAVS